MCGHTTTHPVESSEAVFARIQMSVLSDTTKQLPILQAASPLSMAEQDVGATVSHKVIYRAFIIYIYISV